MAETPIQWCDHSTASVQRPHFLEQFQPHRLDSFVNSHPWAAASFTWERTHKFGLFSLHDHKRQKLATQELRSFAVNSDKALWLPFRVTPDGSRIVEFYGAAVNFGLQPLNNFQMRHPDSNRRIVVSLERSYVTDSNTPLAIYESGDVCQLDFREQFYRIFCWFKFCQHNTDILS